MIWKCNEFLLFSYDLSLVFIFEIRIERIKMNHYFLLALLSLLCLIVPLVYEIFRAKIHGLRSFSKWQIFANWLLFFLFLSGIIGGFMFPQQNDTSYRKVSQKKSPEKTQVTTIVKEDQKTSTTTVTKETTTVTPETSITFVQTEPAEVFSEPFAEEVQPQFVPEETASPVIETITVTPVVTSQIVTEAETVSSVAVESSLVTESSE